MTTSLRTAMLQMLSARTASIVMMGVFFVVLGRLLEPADFGFFAMGLGAFNLMRTLTAFGLRAYVIRSEKELDRDVLGRAAGLSLMIAAMGCTAFLATAMVLGGWLMPLPLALCLVPMGLALLCEPFSLATEAQLHRRLSFRLPAQIAALRTAFDGSIAVGLALLGWGAPALAMGLLASHVLATGLLLALGGAGMRVWPRPSLSGLVEFRDFGRRLTLIRLAPEAADLLLISGLGALAGASVTGLYNRVQVIHRMIDMTLFEGINPVVLPAISNALANGTKRVSVYLTKVELLVAVCWPGYAMIALLADPLVTVLLGPGWEEAVTPVRILAAMGLFMPFNRMSLNYFTAIDELPFYLRMQLQSQVVRLALGLAGAAISLEAFCAAIVAGSAFKAAQLSLWTRRQFGAGHYRAVFARGLFVCVASLSGPAVLLYSGEAGPLLTLLLAVPLAGLGWLLALRLSNHPLFEQGREALTPLIRRGRPQLPHS